ncbi:MAG: DUF1720 domain-containing protein [Myxococcales bacterium]|nr:DUF1720 domain-containing protein [Myxococcales bacterium]
MASRRKRQRPVPSGNGPRRRRTSGSWALAPARRRPGGFAPAQRQPSGFAPAQRQPSGFAPAQRQPSGFAPAQRQPSGFDRHSLSSLIFLFSFSCAFCLRSLASRCRFWLAASMRAVAARRSASLLALVAAAWAAEISLSRSSICWDSAVISALRSSSSFCLAAMSSRALRASSCDSRAFFSAAA